jgi:hypothetical protein
VPSSLLQFMSSVVNRSCLVSTTQNRSDRVVVAIDPHKASWTAAAVDGSLQVLATVRVPVNRTGYRELRRFAGRWPNAGWAIEGATGLGAPLTNRLRADGLAPVDVPAKLAARVRLLSTGHGRKSEAADAVSVGSPRSTPHACARCRLRTRSSRCAPSSTTATT